jgi:hypothetical protein
MTLRSLLAVAFFLNAVASMGAEEKSEKSTPPVVSASASPLPSPQTLAPFETRLANAKSVKVLTSILGLELGSTIKQAHTKLDKLGDPAHPPKEEGEDAGEKEEEHKVLWQLAKTDYSFIFVKADDKDRITYMNGSLRSGKEIPFDKIGDSKKAPVQDANTIAWDVLRAGRPLFRVVAKGADRKANAITIFIVKRPGPNTRD